ncbi:PAS domain S-box-containing protein [Bradyrhizobium sp. AZCC 2262]
MPMTEDNEQMRTMNIPAGLAEALLHSASDAIIATDRDGRITFWNPGAERIFGFTAGQVVGQSLDLIIPENLRARHWEGFRHTMATGTSRYGHGDLLSVPGLTKEGARISVEFTIVLLRNGAQETTGTVAVMRDVTKRFEEVRELKRRLAGAGRQS